ncbi:MAG: histidine kinase, partial [Acidimicrobiia bacterium]|nr:histidine kinase [Acidimicrobiia bacterium]
MDPLDVARPADASGAGAPTPAGPGADVDLGVLVYDAAGKVVWANPLAEQILGVPASALDGFVPSGELFAVRADGTEWPAGSYPVVITATSGRPTSRVVVGFHRPDGSLVWVSMSTRSQPAEAGRPGAVLVRFSDITEHRQAELDTAEREQFFQLLAAHSYDVISRHSLDGTCLYIAPSVLNLLGYPAEALVGKNVMQASMVNDDLAAMESGLRRALNTNDDVTLLWTTRHRNGHTVWLESRGRALRNPGTGTPTEIIAITRDVTERVQAQEALRQSEMLYRTLAESMPGSVVIVVDSEMKVQLAAGTATEVLGVRAEDLVGQAIADLPMMEGLQRLDDYVRAAFEGKTRALEISTALGRRLWTQIAPLGGPPAIGALVMATDITDRLRIEDALREAEQRFTDGFDASPIGMALESPDGRMMRVNDAYCRMVGRSRGQLMGASWREITHPDDLAMTQQNYD